MNRAASRSASIPRAKTAELLAEGTRERGSPPAIAITAPFPGAAIEPVSSLHSDPRAPSGRYAHALRVPFSVEAMRRWRTPDRGLRPHSASMPRPMKILTQGGRVADFVSSHLEAES